MLSYSIYNIDTYNLIKILYYHAFVKNHLYYTETEGRFMIKKRTIFVYSLIWTFAIVFLIFTLYQNMGLSRTINYTGMLRGATQRLVKEEISGHPDDALLEKLDGILINLKTGEGSYDLTKSKSREYIEQLSLLETKWEEIKIEVMNIREGAPANQLYQLSEIHFEIADIAVLYAENYAEHIIKSCIYILFAYLVLSIAALYTWNQIKDKQFKKAYSIDKLTNTINEKTFETRARNILVASNQAYAFVCFDINKFKYINDTYGYEAGDLVLIEIADFLHKLLDDDSECISRISADKFMLLIQQDKLFGEDIYHKIIHQVCIKAELVEPLSLSFGVYKIKENHTSSVNVMMDKAMIAHKMCKAMPNQKVVYYDHSLRERIERENLIFTHMNQALADQEFQLYIQPKFLIDSEQITSGEALVRWQSTILGFLPPDEFIPLFEKNGFIATLDLYMFEQVCVYLDDALYKQQKVYPISVNLSRVTLLQDNFMETFLNIFHKYNIPTSFIEIELTESAFNGVSEETIHLLQSLQNEGFLISMDDFGTGYSSLNLLKELPINILKLDKEFLNDNKNSSEAKGIVSCIVEMAHLLNLQVICEGVETYDQLIFLKSIACDYGQGYYFAKPMPLSTYINTYIKTDTSASVYG